MKLTLDPLFKIAQFATIKVAPGLANLIIIPILFKKMGPSEFGAFSIFLGYALLSIAVLSAIVTQPMYRYLLSDWNSVTKFNGFALITGFFGFAAGFVSAYLVEQQWTEGVIGALLVMCAIIYGTVTVRLQIEGAIGRLIFMEATRVVILLALILGASAEPARIELKHAITVYWLSYLTPLTAVFFYLKPTFPDWAWLKSVMKFGYLSAIWLLLAGLPFALSKTLIAANGNDAQTGSFTANLDMYYRLFSMWNIAIAIWVFPMMSTAYDSGDKIAAGRLHRYALLVYIIGGIVATLAICFVAALFGPFPAEMEDGLGAFFVLVAACFIWQTMSLAHKFLEMSRQLNIMILSIIISLLIFVSSSYFLSYFKFISPSISIGISIIVSALIYCQFVLFMPYHNKSRIRS